MSMIPLSALHSRDVFYVILAGLDVESDTILQAAMIVTDGQLRQQVEVSNSLADLPAFASWQLQCAGGQTSIR